MFTGIIETTGRIAQVTTQGSNKIFWIESTLSSGLKADQSLSHNGVCLTVEKIAENRHRVTAVKETLKKTALNHWENGTPVNLERSLLPASRLDGHFVQGHVDATGICKEIEDRNGSTEITFSIPKKFTALVIEKGSIAVSGVSLTAFEVKKHSFKVAVIPYTWQHTNLQFLQKGEEVNLEFDMIGKYIIRAAALK